MSIFKKKQPEVTAVEPLTVLSAGIESSFRTVITSASGKATIKISDTETLRAWLSDATDQIFAVCLHTSSTLPSAAIFLPSTLLKDFSGAPLPAMETFGTAWISLFPEDCKQTVAYAFSPAKDTVSATLWPFLELQVYQLKLSGQIAWLCIKPALREALSAQKAGASPGTAPAQTPRTKPVSVTVTRPKDFMAFDSLIPQSVVSGKTAFSIDLESFSFVSGLSANEFHAPQASQKTVFYQTVFELPALAPAARLSVILAFQTGEEDAFVNALAIALFQKTLKTYALTSKQIPANPGVKRLTTPTDLSRSGNVLVLRAILSGHPYKIPLVISAPTAVLAPLFQTLLEEAEIKRLSEKPEALVFSFNMKMLSSRLSSILAPVELRKVSPPMLVCELLNHLSDSDYDLVLQNCLINTLSAKGLSTLLYYTETVFAEDGSTRDKIIPLGPLDTRRLFQHMQETFRKTYLEECRQLHANPLDICLSHNTEVMNSIVNIVARKRIVSSARLAWLVREYFQKVTRAQFEEELKNLKNSDFPFSTLKALTPIQAQKAISKLEDRDAALVLLDAKEQKEILRSFMSSVRMVRLEEELIFLRRMYDAWEISPEELLRAKRLLAKACADVKGVDEAD